MKKAPFISLVFVFLLPLLVGIISITTPFTLVSDGELVKFSKDFAQSKNPKVLMEGKKEGIIRPVFLLSSSLPYTVNAADPRAYHAFHLLILSLNSLLIFLIIYTLAKSNFAAVVGSIGYTFTTATSKLWNTLGFEEPFLVFFLLIALYTIVKLYYLTEDHPHAKRDVLLNLFIALVSLFLATFTKQTAVFIIPSLFLLIALSILAIKKVTKFVQAITVITLSEIIFALILFANGSLLNLNLQKALLIKNLKAYIDIIQKDSGWFLPVSLLLFLFILIKKSKDLRHDTAMFKVFCLFFLSLSTSFLIILSDSSTHSNTLLSPVYFALFIFIVSSLSFLFSRTRSLKKAVLGRKKVLGHLLYVGFIIYCLIFFYFQVKEIVKEISSDKERVVLHSDMIKNLAKNLKDDTNIYFTINENHLAYQTEAGLHLDLFYNKKNQIERLNPYMLPPLKNDDIIVVSHQFQDIPDSTLNQILSRKILLYNTYLWSIYKIER